MLESDLPVLNLEVPPKILNDRVNVNTDISVNILTDKIVDEIYLALVIFYDSEPVVTKRFTYNLYAFKIWDHLMSYDPSNPKLQVRVVLYDPHFFMPSMSTFNLIINTPPS